MQVQRQLPPDLRRNIADGAAARSFLHVRLAEEINLIRGVPLDVIDLLGVVQLRTGAAAGIADAHDLIGDVLHAGDDALVGGAGVAQGSRVTDGDLRPRCRVVRMGCGARRQVCFDGELSRMARFDVRGVDGKEPVAFRVRYQMGIVEREGGVGARIVAAAVAEDERVRQFDKTYEFCRVDHLY